MPIVKREFFKKRVAGNAARRVGGTGRMVAYEAVQIVQTKNPFEKHQTVQVTVTLPHDRSKGLLQPLEKKTLVYYNTTFMEAVMKAQQKYRGASISVSTLKWKSEDQKEAAGGNA